MHTFWCNSVLNILSTLYYIILFLLYYIILCCLVLCCITLHNIILFYFKSKEYLTLLAVTGGSEGLAEQTWIREPLHRACIPARGLWHRSALQLPSQHQNCRYSFSHYICSWNVMNLHW